MAPPIKFYADEHVATAVIRSRVADHLSESPGRYGKPLGDTLKEYDDP